MVGELYTVVQRLLAGRSHGREEDRVETARRVLRGDPVRVHRQEICGEHQVLGQHERAKRVVASLHVEPVFRQRGGARGVEQLRLAAAAREQEARLLDVSRIAAT